MSLTARARKLYCVCGEQSALQEGRHIRARLPDLHNAVTVFVAALLDDKPAFVIGVVIPAQIHLIRADLIHPQVARRIRRHKGHHAGIEAHA